MKRTFLYFCVLAVALAANAAEQVGADIRFSLLPVAGDELSEQVVTTVDGKLRQALTRTEAVTDNPVSAFAVRPTLSVSDAASTEGMMMDMTRVKGELTLASFGTVDGHRYGKSRRRHAQTRALNQADRPCFRALRAQIARENREMVRRARRYALYRPARHASASACARGAARHRA